MPPKLATREHSNDLQSADRLLGKGELTSVSVVLQSVDRVSARGEERKSRLLDIISGKIVCIHKVGFRGVQRPS